MSHLTESIQHRILSDEKVIIHSWNGSIVTILPRNFGVFNGTGICLAHLRTLSGFDCVKARKSEHLIFEFVRDYAGHSKPSMSTESDSTSLPRFMNAMEAINQLPESHPEIESEISSGLQELLAQLDGRCFGSSEASHQKRINREKRIETFDFTLSAPYLCFKDRGWTNMRLSELVGIGEVLALPVFIWIEKLAERVQPFTNGWTRTMPSSSRMSVSSVACITMHLDTHWDKFVAFMATIWTIPDFKQVIFRDTDPLNRI
jgi:hypothetical protein